MWFLGGIVDCNREYHPTNIFDGELSRCGVCKLHGILEKFLNVSARNSFTSKRHRLLNENIVFAFLYEYK